MACLAAAHRAPLSNAASPSRRVARGGVNVRDRVAAHPRASHRRRITRCSVGAEIEKTAHQADEKAAKAPTSTAGAHKPDDGSYGEEHSDDDDKVRRIRERGLQLPTYAEEDLAAALAELKAVDGVTGRHADDATMLWFLKDRGLDVVEAAEKCLKYNAWREEKGYHSIAFASVEEEFNTGKAVLLDQRDVLGRQVVAVTLTKHVIAERDLEDTKRLTVYLLDRGLDTIRAGAADGEPETVLTVFDLRGFSTANADIDFLKFFVECIFTYFPKRVSEVLFVEPPFVFRPVWAVVKPWLGKYSSLARFVTLEEANDYFPKDARVFR